MSSYHSALFDAVGGGLGLGAEMMPFELTNEAGHALESEGAETLNKRFDVCKDGISGVC